MHFGKCKAYKSKQNHTIYIKHHIVVRKRSDNTQNNNRRKQDILWYDQNAYKTSDTEKFYSHHHNICNQQRNKDRPNYTPLVWNNIGPGEIPYTINPPR